MLVIVAILSGLTAGLVNRFSNQARVAAAKAVVISAARECLRWLVEAEGRPFDRGTTAGDGLVLSPAEPDICGVGTMFQVTFDEIPGAAYRVTINSDGSLPRDCSGSLCAGGRW